MLEHPDITAALATGHPRCRPGFRHACRLCGAHIYEEQECFILEGKVYCPSCVDGGHTYA